MRSIPSFIAYFLVACLAALVLQSCQEDKIQQTLPLPIMVPPPDVPADFDALIANEYTISGQDVISGKIPSHWKGKRLEGTQLVEFDVQIEGYQTIEDDQGSRPILFKVLAQKNQEVLSDFTLIKFVPADSTIKAASASYLNMGNYSGTISRYDSKGKLVAVEDYSHGKLQKIVRGQMLTNARAGIPVTNYGPAPICNTCGEDYDPIGDLILVVTQMFVDTYVVVTAGTSTTVRYVGSTYTGSRSEWVRVPSGTSHSGVAHEHSGGGGTSSTSSGHPYDIIFGNGFLSSKAGCVYVELKKSGTFTKYAKRFDGTFPVSHLKFNIDNNLPKDINGTTEDDRKLSVIVISINGITLHDKPSLGVAKTIMHETIHAEMYRKLKSVGYQLNPNDFPGIYDYYRRYVKQAQHQQMAAHYVSTIAQALREYDSGKKPDQFYEDFAWDGLIGYKDSSGNVIEFEAWKTYLLKIEVGYLIQLVILGRQVTKDAHETERICRNSLLLLLA